MTPKQNTSSSKKAAEELVGNSVHYFWVVGDSLHYFWAVGDSVHSCWVVGDSVHYFWVVGDAVHYFWVAVVPATSEYVKSNKYSVGDNRYQLVYVPLKRIVKMTDPTSRQKGLST
jgi:hypothetical protein